MSLLDNARAEANVAAPEVEAATTKSTATATIRNASVNISSKPLALSVIS